MGYPHIFFKSTCILSDYPNNWWKLQVVFNFVHFPCKYISYTVCNIPKSGIYHCYAHEDICKLWVIWQPLEGRWWPWPRSVLPLVLLLLLLLRRRRRRRRRRGLGNYKVFTLAVPLSSGRVEFLERWLCEQEPRARSSLSGHVLGWSVSELTAFLIMVYWFQFTDYGLLFVLIWHPGLPPPPE